MPGGAFPWRARWRGRDRYVLLIGAGDALDDYVQDAVDDWRGDASINAGARRHLHIIAIGSSQQSVHALPGFQRLFAWRGAALPDDLSIDIVQAPLLTALAQLQARIDAVWLSAAVVDSATSERLPRALARLLAPDAVMAAPDLRGAALHGLQAAGWQGEGRSLIYASRKPAHAAAPTPQRTAIVIGAGLAGAAICERLCARGWEVTLLERHGAPAMEASGNLAGISMPLLSKDDNLASRLSRAAYLFAGAYWARLGGVGAAIEGARCGVLLVARDAAHALLQQAIATAQPMPPAYARWFDGEAARARFGAIAPHGAWCFEGGLWLRPGSAVDAMLAACASHASSKSAKFTSRFGAGAVTLAKHDGRWQACAADGSVLAVADHAIVASGGGELPQTAHLPLVRVRGQVTHLTEGAAPALDLGLVLCREAYLTPAAGGLHSAGATYEMDDDPALRRSSQDDNLVNLRSMLGESDAAGALGSRAPLAGRVGFRAVAPDRLPMVGPVPLAAHDPGAERLRDLPREAGLHALLGLASRGLTWAPLAAELLAAQLEGEPLPLETALADALDPGRFLLRERRNGRARLR